MCCRCPIPCWKRLRAANAKILEAAIAKDPVTKKVADSYKKYMTSYRQWAKYSEKPYYDRSSAPDVIDAGKLADGIDWFIDLVGRAISWLALAVALVMGANVFLRYGLSIGYIWAQELEWHLLVPLTLIGMSYALRHGEHVRVDVLFANFSDRGQGRDQRHLGRAGDDLFRARGLAVDRLRAAILGDRRRLAQSRRPARALSDEGDDPARLRAAVPAIAGASHPVGTSPSERAAMSLEVLATLMLVAFFVLLLAGIPVGLTLATTGFVFGYLGFGIDLFNLLPPRIFGVVTNYTLLAIPLFVFMGVMLEKSKLAEELMDVIGLAAGSLRGGLGIGIIVVGVLMGATTGIVGATVVTLGLLTLPGMLRRGYDRGLACGIICASGTLGQIIPPSLILILLADITNQSVGTLFAAAMIPGLLLSAIYVDLHPDARHGAAGHGAGDPGRGARRDFRRPARRQDGARGGAADRAGGGRARLNHRRHRRAVRSRRHGRARLDPGGGDRPPADVQVLRETVQATTRITAMVLFILICAQAFSLAFRGLARREAGAGRLHACCRAASTPASGS